MSLGLGQGQCNMGISIGSTKNGLAWNEPKSLRPNKGKNKGKKKVRIGWMRLTSQTKMKQRHKHGPSFENDSTSNHGQVAFLVQHQTCFDAPTTYGPFFYNICNRELVQLTL